MAKFDLDLESRMVREPWHPVTVVGRYGTGTRVRVVRMDESEHVFAGSANETCLLVLDGTLYLNVDGRRIVVKRGQIYAVPSWECCRTEAGSTGTLVLIDDGLERSQGQRSEHR